MVGLAPRKSHQRDICHRGQLGLESGGRGGAGCACARFEWIEWKGCISRHKWSMCLQSECGAFIKVQLLLSGWLCGDLFPGGGSGFSSLLRGVTQESSWILWLSRRRPSLLCFWFLVLKFATFVTKNSCDSEGGKSVREIGRCPEFSWLDCQEKPKKTSLHNWIVAHIPIDAQMPL